MLLVDTETKCLIQDVELKTKISKSRPYGEWLQQQVIVVANLVQLAD
jgi:Glutamine amidotransferases class-II